MDDLGAGLVEAPTSVDRVVGRLTGARPGPTVIVMTGIHGNEPAGLGAARRVLTCLADRADEIRGELVVLAGNLSALRESIRYVDTDLNRHWTEAQVSRVRELGPWEGGVIENREQWDLLNAFDEIVAQARGQVHFLDLHTSSAHGAPFLTVGDTLQNRDFALNFPLPLMLGLEEQVDGSLLEFLNNYGFITLGVEAGQHDSPESVDRHEAVLWLALGAAGLHYASPERISSMRELLGRASVDLPRVLEVRHRHAIDATSRFRMEPGFVNFQPIQAGELMAEDCHGEVHAKEAGRVLLPLYQGKGNDGFFICREVRPLWLGVSRILRRMRVAGLLRFLPGVRRHTERDGVLVVDTRIARFYPLEIFHLLGYRKLRASGNVLLVSRRRFDLAPPARVSFA